MKHLTKSLIIVFLLVSCGEGTRTGNSFGNSDVSITSSAYNTSGTLNALVRFLTLGSVTEFKFCIKEVRLENDDDVAIVGTSGAADVRFTPGLIDVTSGNANKWGDVFLPVGFTLKRIKIKMAKDESGPCGVDYSVRFNGVESDEQIEFEWRFSPSISFTEDTPGITLSLQDFVNALITANDASTLDSDSLKTTIEAIEESAEEND